MLAYEIVLTRESIYDVAEIAEYIKDWFSECDADKFQDNIREEFKKIVSNAKLYTKTHILRILRNERDWENILKGTDNYTYSIQ